MSTEKLTIDSDGHCTGNRRGHGEHGHIALTSLVQLLTACISVLIVALVIQEGARLRERVAIQGREIEELSVLKSAVTNLQEKVSDYVKEVAAMKAQQEVNTQTPEAKVDVRAGGDINLQSESGKTRLASEIADIPWQAGQAHHLRQKRAANTVTWPAGAGACLQGPPGRDGRDGMPGRDCPCGTKDTYEIPSCCSEVVKRSGFNNKAFYVIDPDGPDRGVPPMVVQCDMVGGTVVTLIGHNSEARTHVKVPGHVNPAAGTYSKDVTYWDSMEQVRAVVDKSTRCKQQIKYECYHSVIWSPGDDTPVAWWMTWDGRQADYWGGASPGSGKCACGQSGTCSGTTGRCNCDANDFTWREDSGFLSHKDDLPVTQLRFGDTNNSGEEGYHTLGKLICYP